ncbi:MAG: LytR family transcriptional regulator [Spirochaetales bacterium]|nr:MAG: LytR family transcriptional regulator [Spirochaetales bacterium]
MQNRGIDRSIILLGVILLVVAATVALVVVYVRTDVVTEAVASEQRLGVLFAIELDDGRLITEAFYYQSGTSRGALFDVPPNTGVVVTHLNRVDSIDTIFFTEGAQAYLEAVSDLFSEEMQFYVVMTEPQLEAVVDLLEGIPIFVADIPTEGPDAVRIPNGDVVLDGAKARAYAGYTVPDERERERIARYQRLVIGLLQRLGGSQEVLASRAWLRSIHESITSNLDRNALGALTRELGSLEGDRVITRQIEGVNRSVETEGTPEVLLFPHQEGRWLVESVRQVVENLKSEDAIRDENIVIRLEILNGTDVGGLASRTAQLFRSYGFDVVAVSNAATSEVENTVVIDRVGNDAFARRSADIIRAHAMEVDIGAQAAVDVTIVLGRDFDGRYVR